MEYFQFFDWQKSANKRRWQEISLCPCKAKERIKKGVDVFIRYHY